MKRRAAFNNTRVQLPKLVATYLDVKMSPPSPLDPSPHSWNIATFGLEGDRLWIDNKPMSSLTRGIGFDSTLQVPLTTTDDQYPNVPLMRLGFLPGTPLLPSTAISLRTLAFYKALRSRCPQVGIEPFVRVLCDLHGVRFLTQCHTLTTDVYTQP